MAQRSVIRKGDRTSHGGVVVTGDDSVMIFGQPMARLGDRTTCPKCPGQHTIIEGVASVGSDRRTALEGMKTSCGATLIASQQFYRLEHGGGDGGGAGVNGPADAVQAYAPAAAAAALSDEDAPTQCAHVRNTLDITDEMFEAKRQPVRLTGPSAYQPAPGRERHNDARSVLYEAWPGGQRVPLILERQESPWTTDALQRKPQQTLERLSDLPQPQPEQVANSLGIAPPALLKGRDLQIRIADGMALPDEVARLKAKLDGPPWADPTRQSRILGDTAYSSITLYGMPANQADIDRTVLHELAHSYANNERVDMKAWAAAGKADGNYPSDYARTGPGEDFAEFVVMAVAAQGTQCEAYARSLYPARYQALDGMKLLDGTARASA